MGEVLKYDKLEIKSNSISPEGENLKQPALAIAQAQNILEEAGPSYDSYLERLQLLKQRLNEERFHLAALGQFKRGKSTLLNALLGADVLPTSVIPVTAIPTFVQYGPKCTAKVKFINGKTEDVTAEGTTEQLAEFLAKYVTEERNPHNRLGVHEVVLEYPSSLLQQGVVLIDTPGIGSTFRHNTEATLNFLSQCDAALFIISPDPPITEVEIDFLKEVLAKTTNTFFILTKADYLSDEELSKTVEFLKQALKDHAGIDNNIKILCVSARDGLRAKLSRDEAGWVKSGMQAVQKHLVEFLANQKSSALRKAISKKASTVISDAVLHIGISLASLRIPLDQLEERMRLLQKKLDEVETQRLVQLDVIEGDRKRMIALLEEQAEHLRKKAKSRLLEIVRTNYSNSPVLNEDEIYKELAEAVPVLFEHELGELSGTLGKRAQEVFVRHKHHANELIESIRKAAAELFNVPYQKQDEGEDFEVKRRPYWITHQWSYSLSLLPENFIDRFLPMRIRRSRAIRRLYNQIETIVMQNVENVRWPTLQNLEDTFRKFANQITQQYREVATATRDAIEAAYRQRKEQAEAVQSDIAKLEAIQHRLGEILKELELFVDSTQTNCS